MADKRAEARRRRILDNTTERLQKLKDIKLLEDCSKQQDPQCSVTDTPNSSHELDKEECSKKIKDNDDNIDVKNDIYKDGIQNDYLCADNATTDEDNDTSPDMKTPTTEDDNKSLLLRKYRLLLFVLLGWGIYMVVVKEFDFVLAYLIGRRLPKELLPNLILTAFVAVELQVVVVSLMFSKKSPDTKSQSMITLALTFVGIPCNTLKFIGNVTSMLMAIFTDLCVYIFVIVILKTLDEKV